MHTPSFVEINTPKFFVRNVLVSHQPTEVLLGLRSDTTLWEFPGGEVKDETLEETIWRLLKTQLSLKIDDGPQPQIIAFVDSFSQAENYARTCELFVAIKNYAGFPRPNEEYLRLRWFPFHKIPPNENLMPATIGFVMKHCLPHLEEIDRTVIEYAEHRIGKDVLPIGEFDPDGAA